jgi:hypothetical protein
MEIPWEKLSMFAASTLRKWENPMMPVQELFAIQFDPAWTQEMKRLVGGSGSQTIRKIHSSLLLSRANISLPLDYFSSVNCHDVPSIPEEVQPFVYSLQSMLITSLRLSIYLKMKGCRETIQDVVVQCFDSINIASSWSTVIDNRTRNVSIFCPLFAQGGAGSYVEVVNFDIA